MRVTAINLELEMAQVNEADVVPIVNFVDDDGFDCPKEVAIAAFIEVGNESVLIDLRVYERRRADA